MLALLDCDDARIEAAIEALAAADKAMLDMEAPSADGVQLLANAIDLDDVRGDHSKERWARWPSVPEWRVVRGELGVTAVTVPWNTLDDFYSTLRKLLLDE